MSFNAAGFYVSTISSLDIEQGLLAPRQAYLFPNKNALPLQKGISVLTNVLLENIFIPLNHVRKHIKLHCPSFNTQLRYVLPISDAYIENRVRLVHATGGTELDWFIVTLTSPLTISAEYEPNRS